MAAVADHYREIAALNADVIAISSDSVLAHKVFHDISPSAAKVEYPLLSDQGGLVAQAYGAWSQAGAAERAVYIIDPQGMLRFHATYPVEVGRNIEEILRVLQGLQHTENTREGLPADWLPGKPGIREELSLAGHI